MTSRSRRNKNRNISKQSDEFEKLMDSKVPRNLMGSSPFPPSMTRKLLFHYLATVQDAANPFKLVEFRINAAYRPDNATSPDGFNELAKIYNIYKVTHCRFKCNVASNEPSTPVFFGTILRETQPSTVITTYVHAQQAIEQAPTTGPNLVGETTGQSISRGKWYSIAPSAILGNAMDYYGSTLYTGTSSSNPTNLVWLAFIAYTYSSGVDLTNDLS